MPDCEVPGCLAVGEPEVFVDGVRRGSRSKVERQLAEPLNRQQGRDPPGRGRRMHGDHQHRRHTMNRPLQFVAGVVAAAATATLVWMPTAILAGITFNAID
jgi:hypothetical protein